MSVRWSGERGGTAWRDLWERRTYRLTWFDRLRLFVGRGGN